jgi:hypothetical protein
MPSRGGRRGRAAQQPGGPLQAIAAALTRFTVLMRSADGRQSQQDRDRAIAQLGDALAAIAGGPRCSKFGQSEQAVLRAVLAALRELAALRLERTAGWLHDLAVVLSAWGYALYVLTGDQEFIQESQDWMKQLGERPGLAWEPAVRLVCIPGLPAGQGWLDMERVPSPTLHPVAAALQALSI